MSQGHQGNDQGALRQSESYILALGTAKSVKFCIGDRLFLLVLPVQCVYKYQCLLALYTRYFPEFFSLKENHVSILGWDSNPQILQL